MRWQRIRTGGHMSPTKSRVLITGAMIGDFSSLKVFSSFLKYRWFNGNVER